jgi:hypothetical protein
MNTQREVEVQLSSFFDLGVRWGSVTQATPQPLYLTQKDPVHLV